MNRDEAGRGVRGPWEEIYLRVIITCTEVRFASFLSGGFITAIVVNPPERKLSKRTSVQWSKLHFNLDAQLKIQIFT